MITLAFYKGGATNPWHRIQDAAIRLMTRGKYSHVELIVGRAEYGTPVECLSSSGRDGGVRSKVMVLKADKWDLLYLAIAPEHSAEFIQ